MDTRAINSSLLFLLAVCTAGLIVFLAFRPSRPALVVYCAHDSIYAGKILRDFEQRTRIRVDVRFDSEATKSLGLVELLLREKRRPRCDLFWNNELLGTLQLAEEGLLEPYKGEGYMRIPPAFRDPDGRWCGFAARLRVWIVNTQHLDLATLALPPTNLARLAMAKPLYGTTRTHYTVLWQQGGATNLQTWHRAWRAAGVREVSGNAAVKNLVAEGVCDYGLTDSDDFDEARREGKPVTARPVRVANNRTICIPNTVAIIRGTRRLPDAQKLADFLLSAETEIALANSGSVQIPLGGLEEDGLAKLPAEVRTLKQWAADGVPLTGLDAARRDCLAWLKAEYLK